MDLDRVDVTSERTVPMNVGQAIGGLKLFTGLDADAAGMDAHFPRLVS